MRQGVLLLCFGIILHLMSCNNRGLEEVSIDCKLDSLSGTYNSPFNVKGVSYASVEIKHKKGRTIHFDIETAHIDGCIGKLNGELTLDSNLVGVFLTDIGTNIRFEFHNHNLKIVEQEDCQEHGMRCWFGGEYYKNIE
jgi:hypothetical protein